MIRPTIQSQKQRFNLINNKKIIKNQYSIYSNYKKLIKFKKNEQVFKQVDSSSSSFLSKYQMNFNQLFQLNPILCIHSVRSFHSSSLNEVETVKVPQMAESISEGTLKQWIKKTGDFVKVDEEVATIETDKIDVSVNAPKSGRILETLANEEDTVSVGQDLFKLEPGEEEDKSIQNDQSNNINTNSNLKSNSLEEPAKNEQDAKNKVNSTVDKRPSTSESHDDHHSSSQKTSMVDRKRWDDVQVEKKEKQPHRVEPQLTESKLPLGRTDFDVKNSNQSGSNKPALFDRTERRVKMNRMRSRISERLKQSQNTAASLTTFNEIDMSSIKEMRKLYKDEILNKKGIKFGFMSAFSKAACLALREIPGANASIEGSGLGDTIVYRDYVDLSVAVATPKGLVTPVIRNSESLSLLEIEDEIARLASKAKDNKLSLEDMAGGTFTISNGGVFGSLYGTPIINLPQSAVLGMHAIKDTPVVRNGQIVIRPIMIVALTYDHRILDGREAVTFLVKIKEYIEDPRKMLLS